MAKEHRPVRWEQVSPIWWSSEIGYTMEEEGMWTAYVYRNVRSGNSWTESKPGFRAAAWAKRWVEDHAEE